MPDFVPWIGNIVANKTVTVFVFLKVAIFQDFGEDLR